MSEKKVEQPKKEERPTEMASVPGRSFASRFGVRPVIRKVKQ